MTISILALNGKLNGKILLFRFFFLSGIYAKWQRMQNDIGFTRTFSRDLLDGKSKYPLFPRAWGHISYKVKYSDINVNKLYQSTKSETGTWKVQR